MKILVISPCSARQKKESLSASELYTGSEHKLVMAGLGKVRKHAKYGDTTIDSYIVSTKHGLISEDYVVAPYNVCDSKNYILKGSGTKKLNEDIENLIKNFDLVFFLLGGDYVKALQLPFEVADSVTQIFLLGDTHRNLIPRLPNIHFVPAGKPLADKLRATTRTLKGLMFKTLCEAACSQGFQVFEDVKQNPQRLIEIVQNQ